MVPAGEYVCKAKRWGYELTEKRKLRLAIEYEVLEGERKGQAIYDDLYITEAALPRTVEVLRTLGWVGKDLSEVDAGKGGLDANAVQLVLQDDTYEGKTRAKVKYVNPLRRAAERPAADALKRLGAKLLGAVAEADARNEERRREREARRNGGGFPPAGDASEPEGPPAGFGASDDVPS
jgi:hypothetical protein